MGGLGEEWVLEPIEQFHNPLLPLSFRSTDSRPKKIGGKSIPVSASNFTFILD